MYLQWNRIPKIYEKSVDAYGIKSRCFAGFASRNLRTTHHRARCLSGSEFSANGVSINVRKLSSKTQAVCDYAIGPTLVRKNMAAIPLHCMNPCHRVGLFLVTEDLIFYLKYICFRSNMQS